MLRLKDDEFVVYAGEKEYVVNVPAGDCQIDYTVLADGPCALYIGFGQKVVPLDVGHRMTGRLLVASAQWLVVKPEKKTTMVAIRVLHGVRQVRDQNSGLSAVVQVPEREQYDVRAMVRRLVGQELEEARGSAYDGPELDELVPDDVDTDYGLGHTQLEDDDELQELIDGIRERARAQRARKEGRGQSESRDEGAVAKQPAGAGNGTEPKKSTPAEAKS